MSIVPRFIDGAKGKLFVVEYLPLPNKDRQHTVIFIPPFAEEMNRTRHMVSHQAQLLAELGYTVIVGDLYGTGDSEGGFSDASWDVWQKDLEAFVALGSQNEHQRLSCCALRAGSLFAAELTNNHIVQFEHIVLWHPVTNGNNYLRQLLRLRIASQITTQNTPKESTKDLLASFTEGHSVEIAGYEIPADIAISLSKTSLKSFQLKSSSHVHWFDLVSEQGLPVPPASVKVVEQWQDQDVKVSAEAVQGDHFWNTPETTYAKNLLFATTSVFTGNVS